ncbi:hypothetical protein BC831DRAFT_287158 [Entophlyctis helioformis]|nr:hypothetical protein BC831DRAFT_287158 [Entophlyctis helioformis]
MPSNTRKAPAGFKAMTLKAAAVAWALATLSTSISPVSAQDPVLPASTITVVPTSTLSANSSTIQPSPTSAVIPPTASSVAPTLMPSSSLPRTQPSPSSSSPPGHSPQPDESGVPVAFELVAQTGYAVLTQTPACNATVVGIVVTWQTDAAASAASLNRNATLCASEPGVETRLIGSFSDVLSGALYVLYTAANTTMVSSVDTKTLEVTHLPPIDAAVGKIVSIAVLRPSPTTSRPGPNTPPSLALLAPSTGLWTIPLGTSPSVGNAYTRRVQFNPSQKVAVDMQVGDPFIFVLGINPQNGPEAFYLSKIDTRDFSEVDNSFSIPRASLMGPHLIDNDLDAATLVRKPLLLCDSTAYVVFTSPTSLGLTLLTFNTTRLEINKASGSVISSLDTLISVACIHGQPAPGGADFSGVAVVAEPFAGGLAFNASMDTTAPYVVTVDKDCKSSRSKAIPAPRGAATLTTSRSPMSRATQQEFSVASILSAERVQTLGLFRISTSDVRQWYVDVLPLSFLGDAIPGNETCQAGFVFSSLERMCVECRSVTPPPESCISVFPRAMDSFNWFEALNPLLKTSVVFGAFVFATLLVGTVMYYANRGGEDRNQRAELMSQQLKRSQAARTGQHVVPRPMQPKPHQAVEPPPRAAVADSAHMNQSSNNADIARSLGITETGSGSSSASGSSTHSPDCRGSNLMRQTGERRAGAGIRPAYVGNDMSRLVSEFDASLAKLSPLDHHNGISPNLHKTVNDGRDAQEYRNGAAERRHISLVTRTCSEASVAVQIETATPATTMPRPQPAQDCACPGRG